MRETKRLLLTLVLTLGAVLLTSCGTKNAGVVLVPEGSVIQIGPKTKGYVRYYQNGGWILSEKPVVIPDGWYATSLSP